MRTPQIFRHKPLLFLALAVLCGLSMVSPWASPRQKNGPKRPETRTRLKANAQASLTQAAPARQSKEPKREEPKREESDDGEADLPIIAKGIISKEEYFRLREEHLAKLRGLPYKTAFNPRTRAIREMETQMTESRRRLGLLSLFTIAPAWTSIGPSPIPMGQTQGTADNVSGRVTAIAIHPTDPNRVYVGVAQGGVYRSLDGGANWTQIFDNALSLAIGAIAIAPSNPTTIFVGTGEGNFSNDSFFGVGLYRIDNAETTATLVGPIDPGANFNGASISKIIVHPTDANTVFVSTVFAVGGIGANFPAIVPNRGLFRSANALSASPTFTRLNVPTGSFSADVVDVVIEPGNVNNLICAVRNNSNTVGGIWRSTNALAATPTFTNTLGLGANIRAELAINRVGTTVTVLAATGEASGSATCTGANEMGNGLLRRSTDGGATWPATIAAGNGFCNGQCFYDIAVAIDPNNANNFYLGGSTQGTCATMFRRTTDGGATFPHSANRLHADTHVIALAPSNPAVIYVGNDGGVWRSGDSGANWASLNNAGFSATQFQSLALHPADRNFMIGGTQDNGTNHFNPGSAWSHVDNGDGGFALIDQNAANTTNVTMYHTYFNQTNSLIGLARTTTTGFAWTFLGASVPAPGMPCTSNNGINCADNVLFYAPMALGPGNPNTVYFGTDRLYRSTDTGTTMTAVSQAFVATVSAIGISSQNDNVRLIGLSSGRVFLTTTGANPLTDITGPWPSGGFVARAAIDPGNVNTAYITLSDFGLPAGQHIWRTTNLNAATPTWTVAGAGIPDVPVNAFVMDPNNTALLYAGTDIGVYHSCDSGLSWRPYGTGLPRVAVFDMAIQNPNRILRVATHGRGIWEIPVNAPQADLQIAISAAPATVITGSNITYTLTVKNNGPDCDSGITITDNLPTSTTFFSCFSSNPNVTCGGSGNNRSITIPSLGENESVTIILVATANCSLSDGTLITNSVSVSSLTNDPNAANNSASVTVTASNPPPVITCPADRDVVALTPGSMTTTVTFPDPIVTDNCPGATVACIPPSNSSFSLGTTTVNCKATDSGGATASCSFKITVWDVCIQDDESGDFLLFNSFTGDYKFVVCGPSGFVMTGRGVVRREGCVTRLTDDTRVVTASFDRCLIAPRNSGGARVKRRQPDTTFIINDRNILNNSPTCP